ncbi:hypothetical protein LCGC14_2842210 [marine sediment metagenome]|uniref:Uncharacterized protein n=1 Tax=marine sediment metagenome TaxID=412755 RepID=A0A0F8YXL3_9ZZZZ
MKMIVNELESIESEEEIMNRFARSITAYVSNLPEGILDYTLYMLDNDPQGLFIKYYLLSVAAGESNDNLEELMHLWDVSEGQFVKYEQELIEEGLL